MQLHRSNDSPKTMLSGISVARHRLPNNRYLQAEETTYLPLSVLEGLNTTVLMDIQCDESRQSQTQTIANRITIGPSTVLRPQGVYQCCSQPARWVCLQVAIHAVQVCFTTLNCECCNKNAAPEPCQ